MAKNEISLIIKKKLKIQKTKTLLKKAIDMKMSMKEHLVKFSIKEMIKTVAAKIVVLRRRLEHLKVPRGLSFF